jgi:hypothetical protein
MTSGRQHDSESTAKPEIADEDKVAIDHIKATARRLVHLFVRKAGAQPVVVSRSRSSAAWFAYTEVLQSAMSNAEMKQSKKLDLRPVR